MTNTSPDHASPRIAVCGHCHCRSRSRSAHAARRCHIVSHSAPSSIRTQAVAQASAAHATAATATTATARTHARRRRAHGAHQQSARQRQPPAGAGAASGCAAGAFGGAAHAHWQRSPRKTRTTAAASPPVRSPPRAIHPRRRRRQLLAAHHRLRAHHQPGRLQQACRSARSTPTSSPHRKRSFLSPIRPSTTRSQAQALLQVAEQTVNLRQTTQTQVNQLTRNKLRSTLDLSFADVDLSQGQLLATRRAE